MGLVDGLLGAGMGIFGMAKAASANKKLQSAQESVLGKNKSLANWYDKQSNTDYFDTTAARSGLARIRTQYDKGLATSNQAGVQAGATTEAKIANKASMQDSYNRALSNMTGYGTQYQTNMKRAYGNELTNLYNGNNAAYKPAVDSWGNLAKSGWDIAGKGLSNSELLQNIGKKKTD